MWRVVPAVLLLAGCSLRAGEWELALTGEMCPAPSAPAEDIRIDAVAWNGTDWVVGWTRVWGEMSITGDYSDVIVARVSPEGELRDAYGIPITTSEPKQIGTRLAAAPDGQVLVGFWEGEFTGDHAPLLVARMEPDGTVLDPDGVVIGEGDVVSAITYAGDGWIVVWTVAVSSGFEMRAARLSRDLEILDPGGILLTTASLCPGSAEELSLAAAGLDALLVWSAASAASPETRCDIHGALLRGADFATPQVVAISADARTEWTPAVTHDGTQYVVAWSVPIDALNWSVLMAGVSSEGVATVPITAVGMVSHEDRPALAHAGGITALAYTKLGVEMQRFDGTLATVGGPIDVGLGGWPKLAASGDGFLATWSFGAEDAARVGLDGAVQAPFRVVNAAGSQSAVSITGWSEGQGPVLVWREVGAPQVRAARLDGEGMLLDPEGIPLVDVGGTWGPAVARAGDAAVAVIDTGNQLEAVPIRADGSLGTSLPVSGEGAPPPTGDPGIDCSDTGCLIAWHPDVGVRVARMTLDGTVNVGGVALDDHWGIYYARPDVARHPGGYLVTWERRDREPDPWEPEPSAIMLARVTDEGEPMDSGGVMVAEGRLDTEWAYPRIAVSGSRALLIWLRPEQVHALLIDAATATRIGDEIVLSTPRFAKDGLRSPHAVIGHPDGFLLVWETLTDLVGQRLSREGVLLDDEPFLIAEGGFDPVLATGDDGRIVIGYARFFPDPPYLSNRITARFFGGPPVPEGTCQ